MPGDSGHASRRRRPWWMRPAIHTAIVGAVIGYLIGHLLGNFLDSSNVATEYPNLALSDSSDWPIVLGYALAMVGWLAGLGVFNDLLRQMVGRPVPVATEEEEAVTPAWPSTSGSPSTTRWSGSST